MRTTINIDDNIFEDLMRATDAKTKSEAVRIALSEFIFLKRKKKLLALRGNLDIENNWQELRRQELKETTLGNGDS